jgi:hypothetical protein
VAHDVPVNVKLVLAISYRQFLTTLCPQFAHPAAVTQDEPNVALSSAYQVARLTEGHSCEQVDMLTIHGNTNEEYAQVHQALLDGEAYNLT